MKRKEEVMIRALLILLALMAIGLLTPTSYVSATNSDIPIVLVAPFENLSGVRSMITYEAATGRHPDYPKRTFVVDRYSEAPKHILEDILINLGAKVIERQRLDAILLETELGRLSGLVDPEKAIRLGKMLGANFIIMGTITNVGSRRERFSGYGISTSNEVVTCSVRVRAIDVRSGSVLFSMTVQGSGTFMSSNFGGVNDSDVAYAVIQDALFKLKSDKNFKQAIMQGESATPGQEVTVKFAPIPDNSDVVIDGIYKGGSPLVISLPSGRSIRVKISKAGYETWEATVVPADGLLVKPELEKKPKP